MCLPLERCWGLIQRRVKHYPSESFDAFAVICPAFRLPTAQGEQLGPTQKKMAIYCRNGDRKKPRYGDALDKRITAGRIKTTIY